VKAEIGGTRKKKRYLDSKETYRKSSKEQERKRNGNETKREEQSR
jgi:hypothetical protein